MTAKDFRQIALSLPETEERAHMSHPDFRVAGKIFATLGYPDASAGVVKLTPSQQAALIRSAPGVFRPIGGKWGEKGATTVQLHAASARGVKAALEQAWSNVAPKSLAAGPQPRCAAQPLRVGSAAARGRTSLCARTLSAIAGRIPVSPRPSRRRGVPRSAVW